MNPIEVQVYYRPFGVVARVREERRDLSAACLHSVEESERRQSIFSLCCAVRAELLRAKCNEHLLQDACNGLDLDFRHAKN